MRKELLEPKQEGLAEQLMGKLAAQTQRIGFSHKSKCKAQHRDNGECTSSFCGDHSISGQADPLAAERGIAATQQELSCLQPTEEERYH